jgi:hypothetical protein
MSGSLSANETDVTQPNIGGIMNLLNTGQAFVTSLINDATALQGTLNEAVTIIQDFPAGLINISEQSQVTSIITQLQTMSTTIGSAIIVHITTQLANLSDNLQVASGQASAQVALLAQGGSLPSSPPITAANPTGNMEALFGSIMGLGELLVDRAAGQLANVIILLNQIEAGQVADVPTALNTLSTYINNVNATTNSLQNMLEAEIAALASATSDLIFYATATSLADSVSHPCAQVLLGAVGSQSLQDHVNLTGAIADTLTPLWAYPVIAAPATINDFELAPTPNPNAILNGVIAPTFSSPPTSNSLTISWTNPVTGNPPWTFQVQYTLSGENEWTNWGSPITGFTTTITGLSANTQYDIRLICTNAEGSSTSPTITAATASAIIGAPSPATGLTTGAIDTNSIALSWTAPFGGDVPVTYQVRYRASGAYFWNDYNGTVSATNIVVAGLSTNSPYDLQVISINDVGTSISATLTTQTTGFTITPVNPIALPTPPVNYPTTPTTTFPTATLPLGAYVGDPSATNAAQQSAFVKQFESFAAAMGRNPSLLNTNISETLAPANWGVLGADPIVAAWRGTSFLQPGLMIPVLGLPMFSSGLTTPTVPTVPTLPTVPILPTIVPTVTPTIPTIVLPTIPTAPTTTAPQLPSGYFITSGSQITTSSGLPVRICAINWRGADKRYTAPLGLDVVNYQTLLTLTQASGFNCLRILTNDVSIFNNDAVTNVNTVLNPSLAGLNLNQILIAIVDYCGTIGLRVIIDSHNNEGIGGTQANGLWYDLGGTTNNTDGSGTAGTISDATFTEVWRTRASLFQNKPAILGYDIRSLPQSYSGMCTWGDAGVNDLHAMYVRVGKAIQAIDSGPLIICAGPENFNTTFSGTGTAPSGDLTAVSAYPVVLNTPKKVVYTVHEYPNTVLGSNAGADNGPQYISRMQNAWGYLISNNIAPVWVGECGTSMQDPTEKAWGQTFISYVNGLASGGPTFIGNQQGIGIGWWDLEPITGTGADQFGVLLNWNGAFDANQRTYWGAALYTSRGNASPTIPTPTVTIPTIPPTIIFIPPTPATSPTVPTVPTTVPTVTIPTIPTPIIVTPTIPTSPTPTVVPTPTPTRAPTPTPTRVPTTPTAPTPTRPTPTVPTVIPTPTMPTTYTFDDEFNTLILHDTWQAGDNWQLIAPDSTQGRGGPNWGESGTQYWVNPYNPNTPISGLYAVSNGQLKLALLPTPASSQAWINNDAGANMPFVGALLNSSPTDYQQFGYYEISVAVDRIPGFTFQLDIENVQLTGHFPPEIDLIIYTDANNVQYLLFQIAVANEASPSFTLSSNNGYDGSIAHVYGFNWQTDYITLYMDGMQLYRTQNPGGVYQTDKQFMYLVTYANYPQNSSPSNSSLPAYATLDYVRVSQNRPSVPTVPTIATPTVITPTPTPVPTRVGVPTATPTPTRPTPTPTVPTTGNAYITPGNGSFTSGGNTYSIDANGNALENGLAITGGAGTSAMDLFNGVIYGQDAVSGSWYTFDGTNFNGPVAAPTNIPTTPTVPTVPTVPTAPTGQFRVSNGLIQDPGGNNFIARGINLYDYYTYLNPQTILNVFPGLNFIRLNCFGYTGVDSASSLQTFVSQCTSLKIVVEIEDHTGISAPPYTGSALTTETNWYSSIASAFKNNPYVWFGTFNEASNPSNGALSAQHAAIYTAIRSTGNTNPIMMCLISGGNPGTIGTGNGLISSTYTSMTNIFWDLHQYSWTTNYSTDVTTMKNFLLSQIVLAQQLTSADGIVPVVIGEYGISTNGATVDPGGTQLCEAVQESGYGCAAWGWDTGESDNLTDGNGNLTSYGQQVAGWIASGSP